jgi:hypothetical protein
LDDFQQQTNPIKTMMTLEELEGSIRKENATKSQQQNPEAFGGGDQQRFVFDNNHPMNSAANLTRQQLTNTQVVSRVYDYLNTMVFQQIL